MAVNFVCLWSSLSLSLSLSSGTSFKTSRKNQYEEVLFKCEDDRYELDMVIELNCSTMRALEPIMQRIIDTPDRDLATFKLPENALDGAHCSLTRTPKPKPKPNANAHRGVDTVLSIRSIERIYSEKNGVDIIEKLFSNPVVAVPVILRRLRQKDREWKRARKEWNKIWREVNDKNYHKSLDHQSLAFKQAEKRVLSPKGSLLRLCARGSWLVTRGLWLVSQSLTPIHNAYTIRSAHGRDQAQVSRQAEEQNAIRLSPQVRAARRTNL